MPTLRPKIVVAGVALAMLVTACAVVPTYPETSTSFQGFPVVSSIPAHPRGIVFVFHGTTGSAEFADRIETVDVLNHLVAAGYGFAATESTDRTAKQWDNASLSVTTNPDLARLASLRSSLIASGRITASTPIYTIGMSQGAGFASVFARAFHDAGLPVAAIAPSHGQVPAVVRNAGGPGVPIFSALGANDAIVDNGRVVLQIAALQRAGLAADVVIEPETPLAAVRFLRVPGIDGDTASAIFSALVHAGLWDGSGQRLASIDAIEAALPNLTLPAAVTAEQGRAIGDEIDVVLAVHQYSATYADRTVAWFDAHR